MRRDNLSIVTVAASAVSLEAFILISWWRLRGVSFSAPEADWFLIFGQAYLVTVCVAIYFMTRRIVRPLSSILEGIELYAKGRLDHRIPPSRVRELHELGVYLNRMAARLGGLDALKNELIANVSHELRSPLAAMESYIRLTMTEDALSQRSRENLLRVDKNLARLRRLVENLLDVSQIEAKEVRCEPEAFRIAEAIRDSCALLRGEMAARRLRLRLNLGEGSPEAWADPAKCRQVLANLLDNAVKYNKADGEIAVSLSQEADRLVVEVRDTGPGIPRESLEAIFERFHRLPPATPEAARIKGVGLGLSISRSLARAMGGDVRAQTGPGAGSTFLFTLPARKAP